MMLGIISSELLKLRHTFSLKLAWIAPLITILLGYFLSGDDAQIAIYNWWYLMILPLVATLVSANAIICEKKTGMQNIVCFPIEVEKFWFGKIIVSAILLFVANILLWIFTTMVGFLTKLTVSPIDGWIGCLLLFCTYLWQIAISMWLTDRFGFLPTVVTTMAANVIFSILFAEKEYYFAIPYAIPPRIVCPYFKVHINGLPIEEGSPLLSNDNGLLALMICLLLAFVLSYLSAKRFSRRAGE